MAIIKTVKINFGCGKDIKKGYTNTDIFKLPGVDKIVDLNVTPYSFKDNSADEIMCMSVLQYVDNVVKVIDEFHRILKPGGKLILNVPHFTFANTWIDPLHKKGFSYYSLHMFVKKNYYHSEKKFSKIKVKLVFGKRYALWNYLIEWIANKKPHVYEDTPLRVFPAMNLDIVLVK